MFLHLCSVACCTVLLNVMQCCYMLRSVVTCCAVLLTILRCYYMLHSVVSTLCSMYQHCATCNMWHSVVRSCYILLHLVASGGIWGHPGASFVHKRFTQHFTNFHFAGGTNFPFFYYLSFSFSIK